MNNYPHEDLLSGFIDGELDSVQEEQLFEQLAASSELRTHLRGLQTIRTAATNYTSYVTPPAELTKATFTSLGFTSALQPAQVGAAASILAILSAFIHRYWLPMAAVIVSSALTTAVIFTVLKSSQASVDDSVSSAGAQAAQRNGSMSPSTAHGSVIHSHIEPTRGTSRIASAAVSSSLPTALSQSRLQAFIDTILNEKSEIAVDEIQMQHYHGIQPPTSEPITHEIFSKQFHDRLVFSPTLPERFTLEYRNFELRSYPDATVPARSDPWFNNMSIGLFYTLTEHQNAGLEFGQEAFPQHYSGIENGKGVRYEQNLLTSWLAAAYRYKWNEISWLGGVRPFLSTSMGATVQAWSLVRSSVGIRYTPDRRVTLMIGADGSLLLYQFQNTWFTTKKVGVVYGITFSF